MYMYLSLFHVGVATKYPNVQLDSRTKFMTNDTGM